MKEKPRILLIDDDEDFVEATKIILQKRPFEVIVALNSQEGYKKLEEERPDLIILDVMMEKKAMGFIFARKLRKDPQFNNIPILMLTSMRQQTGFFFPGEVKDPVFLPVDELIEKPVDANTLIHKIEEILKKIDEKK